MSKVKQWATEIAENAVGCVINDYLKNKINSEDAKSKIFSPPFFGIYFCIRF